MTTKPLVSITIPTYNRAFFLKEFLDNIAAEAKTLNGIVEVCILNDGSTDNTRQMVQEFQKANQGLVRYQENDKNLGVAAGMLLVMGMAQGKFIWLFGDDDIICDNGLKKVVDFIQQHCNDDTGLVALANKSYYVDPYTKKEVVYFQTVEKDKGKVYSISREDIIRLNFPNSGWMSILIYNNFFFQKIMEEEKSIIEEVMNLPRGVRDYVYMIIYQLMFLKYAQLQAMRLNELIVQEEMHYYKLYVEDKFNMHFVSPGKRDRLLRFGKFAQDYQAIVQNQDRMRASGFIAEMVMIKSFGHFNYISFWKCLKLFFKESSFIDALKFSIFFVALLIVPQRLLQYLFKQFIKSRHKERWQEVWLDIMVPYGMMSKGTRRMVS